MQREIPEAILLVNFGLLGENFVTILIYAEIKWQIMEELCEVGPKNLRNNLRS